MKIFFLLFSSIISNFSASLYAAESESITKPTSQELVKKRILQDNDDSIKDVVPFTAPVSLDVQNSNLVALCHKQFIESLGNVISIPETFHLALDPQRGIIAYSSRSYPLLFGLVPDVRKLTIWGNALSPTETKVQSKGLIKSTGSLMFPESDIMFQSLTRDLKKIIQSESLSLFSIAQTLDISPEIFQLADDDILDNFIKIYKENRRLIDHVKSEVIELGKNTRITDNERIEATKEVYSKLKTIKFFQQILEHTHAKYKKQLKSNVSQKYEEKLSESIRQLEKKLFDKYVTEISSAHQKNRNEQQDNDNNKNYQECIRNFYALKNFSETLMSVEEEYKTEKLNGLLALLNLDSNEAIMYDTQEETNKKIKQLEKLKDTLKHKLREPEERELKIIHQNSYEEVCMVNLLQLLSRWVAIYDSFAAVCAKGSSGVSENYGYEVTKKLVMPFLNNLLVNPDGQYISMADFHKINFGDGKCGHAIKFKRDNDPKIFCFFLIATPKAIERSAKPNQLVPREEKGCLLM